MTGVFVADARMGSVTAVHRAFLVIDNVKPVAMADQPAPVVRTGGLPIPAHPLTCASVTRAELLEFRATAEARLHNVLQTQS